MIVFDDADMDVATKILAATKFCNAGQVCASPTHFLIQSKVYDSFVGKFIAHSKALKVGNGLDPETTMGPLAHEKRLHAIEDFVADAMNRGAEMQTGGERIGRKGFYYAPTVLTGTPRDSRVMNAEPFGPMAVIMPFPSSMKPSPRRTVCRTASPRLRTRNRPKQPT